MGLTCHGNGGQRLVRDISNHWLFNLLNTVQTPSKFTHLIGWAEINDENLNSEGTIEVFISAVISCCRYYTLI